MNHWFNSIFSAANVEPGNLVTTSLVNGVLKGSYTTLLNELCKNPEIDDVLLSANGNLVAGTVLTATVIGRPLGPFAIGTHEYKWFRTNQPRGGVLVEISGATASQYTLVNADENNYIICFARFVQIGGTNNKSRWMYSTMTGLVAAAAPDITHAWRNQILIENGSSVPANWNDAGVSPALIDFGTSDDWITSDTTKPFYDSVKKALVFSNAHRVAATTSMTHPPVTEMWIKGKYTAITGALLGWGSQTLFGMSASQQYTIPGMTAQPGDFSEHVWRIVLNGINSKYQMDKGVEVPFTDGTVTAQFLAFGQTYSGANPADCELKRFERTASGVLLTSAEVAQRWTFFGY